MAAYSTDQFMGQPSGIHLVNIADDIEDQKADVIKSLTGPKGRITRVAWTDLNRALVTAGEDGFVRRWDVEVCISSAADLNATFANFGQACKQPQQGAMGHIREAHSSICFVCRPEKSQLRTGYTTLTSRTCDSARMAHIS